MFCLNLMRIALELAKENRVYEALATKFFQHYVYVGAAMKHMGGRDYQLWDEEDGFFYDVLRYPDGRFEKFRVRSLVGLIPLFAVERLEDEWIEPFKEFRSNLDWFLENQQHIVQDVCHPWSATASSVHVLRDRGRGADQAACCARVLDPDGVPLALRACAACRATTPSTRSCSGSARGALRAGGGGLEDQGRQLELARADLVPDVVPDDRVAAQAGHGLRPDAAGAGRRERRADGDLWEVARGPGRPADPHLHPRRRRAAARSTAAAEVPGRPALAGPVLFYEYFHGDTGAGLGASHQTGWTGLVASLIDEWRRPPQPSSR